ncbi:MAG TPA: cyclic nucleotide-binding domain-containing protein [Syntrophobacteria bacterium]|nr:cyclic nucleotide-binding domain-containing protein [Syntrophobacteria bacterium]
MSSSTEKEQVPRISEFQANLEILRQLQFFSGLSIEALKLAAYLSARQNFRASDLLFKQDDRDGTAFYIVSGEAGITRDEERGGTVLRTYGRGEFLGGLALVCDMRRLFTLRALTAMTCVTLTRDRFTKVLEQFPEVTAKILQTIAEAINLWEERLLTGGGDLCEVCGRMAGMSLL